MNNIKRSIRQSKMSRYQLVAVTVCIILYMLDGFDVLVMAFTAASVAEEWGLRASQVGTLLSTGLIGMAVGAMFVAPLADTFGRRALVLICLIVISFGMLFSAASQGLWQLASLRVITGVGIGGMLATLTVIVAEYSSDKWRNFNVSVLATGFPMGAVLGGSIAAILLIHFGWRSVFLFGALASFLMIPLVIWRLPESLDFLLVKRSENALEKINTLLRHMGQTQVATLPPKPAGEDVPSARFGSLFALDLKLTTIMIWLAFFMVMYSFYFVMSWTPKLLVAAGLSEAEGISGGVLINLGGIAGGLLFGYIAWRIALCKLVSFYMLATAVLMVIFGLFSLPLGVALGVGIVTGFFLFGSMIGLYALTPSLYAPSIRTTGMGWALGVGRIGAILSPVTAGILLDRQWQTGTLCIVFAIPMVCAMLAIYKIHSVVERDTFAG